MPRSAAAEPAARGEASPAEAVSPEVGRPPFLAALPRRLTPGTLTAIVALVAGLVSLAFTLRPSLRPDPRDVQAGTLKAAAIEEGVTLADFLARIGAADSDEALRLSPCARRLPGTLVYAEVDIRGFKSRDIDLRFYTYNARTGRRLRVHPKHWVNSSPSQPAARLTGEVPSDRSVWLQWVRWPYRDGRFFVRFELYKQGSWQMLSFADTKPFNVSVSRFKSYLRGCKEG